MKIMEQIFLTVLNMSAAASVVIAVVLLARLLLRHAPKKWSYLLWSVVAFRLCCPVSFKAVFSVFRLKPLQGAATAAAADTAAKQTSAITYIPQITAPSTPVTPLTPTTPPTPVAPTTPVTPVTPVTPAPDGAEAVWSAPSLMTVLTWLWVAGVIVMIGYSIYSYVKMRRLVGDAVLVRDNVYETDRIRTPFILGLVRPRIYIPAGMVGEQLDYVLAHEGYHLRRGDHVVKTLAFALLTVHWFNPLVWLAFHLMGKDMEMSCDEKVLGQREGANREYSNTLLSFAAPERFPAATPLCFGESGAKSRIKNALRWRRPRAWVTVLAAALCLAVLAACAVNPKAPETDPKPPKPADEQTNTNEQPRDSVWKVTVIDLGSDTFRLANAGRTPGLDMTVKLPASWAGRYSYQITDTGIEFYCKTTYKKTYDEGYHGNLCGIMALDEVISAENPLWEEGRVLAVSTADNYSVVLTCPGDVQFTPETQAEYESMYADRDKVTFTFSNWMEMNTWTENTGVVLFDRATKEPVLFTDGDASAIRGIVESRIYEKDPLSSQRGEAGSFMGILAGGREYDLYYTDNEEDVFICCGKDYAPEPLSPEERGYLWSRFDNSFVRVIQDDKNGVIRLENNGYTPGLDFTIRMPESWIGRYGAVVTGGYVGGLDRGVSQYHKTYIDIYSTRVNEEAGGNFPQGVLCTIAVKRNLAVPFSDSKVVLRVLEEAEYYTVMLLDRLDRKDYSGFAEYADMAGDLNKIQFINANEAVPDFSVKITDLGGDTFRVEDAGYTPGLDLTVKLPASWARRYTYQITDNEINFFCEATYKRCNGVDPHGKLFGIWVRNEAMSPDDPLWGDSRVLAVGDGYSVVLTCPGDVQFTEETAVEYQAMYADKDKVEITLSDWMLANTRH